MKSRKYIFIIAFSFLLLSVNTKYSYSGDLSQDYQNKLNQYASGTVRYFTSSQSNNKPAGFPHAFFGTGKFQIKDGNGWREENWDLTRGYGSHVNMNEVTLRLLALAVAYKMGWLDYLPDNNQYSESWGQILIALQTIQGMQRSGNSMQFTSKHFHRTYLTTIVRGSEYDADRYPDEIIRPNHEDIQSSDDNALPYLNLLLLEGLAGDITVAITGRDKIIKLCREIRSEIDLKRFLFNNTIIHNYQKGQPSTGIWNRLSAEGPLILAAMLISGQITTDDFYNTADSFENMPVKWNSFNNETISIQKPSFHAAMFIHGLRAIHGMPVTAEEFVGLNFYNTSVKPLLKAHLDFAEHYESEAVGSQVMTQVLFGIPVVEKNGAQVQYPGNENNRMPVPESSLSPVTGSHAWFVPLARWRKLDANHIDILFHHMTLYESEFFHQGSDVDLGWEAAIPWQHTDTSNAWLASDGTWRYTDWGRPYEALNTAYTVLSIFDALNPDKPLAAYNAAYEKMKHIAAYFDQGILLPEHLFKTTATVTETTTATPTFTPSAIADYSATPTVTAAYSPTLTCTTDHLFIGLDITNNIALAYPNPGRDKVNFIFHFQESSAVRIDIYNINGERVSTLTRQFTAGRAQRLCWLCQNISSGIYIARVYFNSKYIISRKIAIIK